MCVTIASASRQAWEKHEALAATPGSGGIRQLFQRRGHLRRVQPDCTVLLHGQRATDFFLILEGTVRCCTFTEDGRRCIFRFAGPGDIIGFTDYDRWHFTAEAVDRVELLALRRETADRAFDDSHVLQREARSLVSHELAAREEQLVLIAYTRAQERLHWFLENRWQGQGQDGFDLLPMTRRDIADHLGMTIETVSRGFTALRREGLIEMCGHDRFRMVTGRARHAA